MSIKHINCHSKEESGVLASKIAVKKISKVLKNKKNNISFLKNVVFCINEFNNGLKK